MNENINLCEILKGHEGETFYSIALGNVKLHKISEEDITLVSLKQSSVGFKCSISDTKQDLFPSKDQRDWNKWDEENNKKTPKTWSKLIKNYNIPDLFVNINKDGTEIICGSSPIEKSALALLKIHQLIEIGYGGNVTYNCFENQVTYSITHCGDSNSFEVYQIADIYKYSPHIHFHTKEQAEEFLSYPENVQLLKDYFML